MYSMKKFIQTLLFLVLLLGVEGLLAQDSTAVAAADTVAAAVEQAPKLVKMQELFSVTKILSTLMFLVGAFLVNRLLTFLLGTLAERRSAYRLMIKRILPFVNILVWTTAVFIVIAGIIAPPMETVIAVGASVGIAIGFASQDILKNVFGGFIILFDRPFQVGDKIEVNGHYGEVTEIGLRSTRIVTPDDSLVSVPNADIVSNSVSNSNTGALDCQVVVSMYLPADSPVTEVKDIAWKAAVSSRYVYLKKPVVVMTENMVHEQNYVLRLKVKAYVLDIRYEFLLKSDITELIMEEFNARKLTPKAFSTPEKAAT